MPRELYRLGLTPLGRIVATPGALDAGAPYPGCFVDMLTRHQRQDWGDLEPDDRMLNDKALDDGGRLLSAYHLPDGTKVWVITEADRSATTIMLPSEY